MSPTKKPSKLSADERAFLDRIHSLNEEETEKLTFEEMNALPSSAVRKLAIDEDLLLIGSVLALAAVALVLFWLLF